MFDQNIDVAKGWDAREQFVKELVFRLNRVGLCNDTNQRQWIETLTDYLDMACVYFQDEVKKFQDRLDNVNIKIYAKKKRKNGGVIHLTNEELTKNKVEAYKELRQIFRDMHIAAYNKGAYMPIKGTRDPKRAVAGYNDQKK